MKNTIKALLSMMLILAMVFSVAGCGNEKESSETAGVNDDFFTDEVTNTVSDETDSVTSDSKDTSSGGSQTTQSQSSSKTSTPAESTVGGKSWKQVLASMPKSLRGTTVTVMNWNPMSEYTGAAAAIKEFEKQTGITVKWQTIDMGVYTTRLASMVASNTAPDVVKTCTPTPSWMQSFQPLSAAKYDFTDEAWDKAVMKDYSVNGVPYAVSVKGTHLGSVNMMFYNKDLISKYDYEDPYKLWKSGKWSWKKFLDMCRQYKKDSNAELACTGANWDVWTELYGLAGPVGFDGTKYYSNLNNSKFLTVTQEIADLYHVEKLFSEGRAEYMDAGDCLFYAGAAIYLRRNNTWLGELKSAGTLYAVPMPPIDGQSTYYQGRHEYEAYAISQGAKNPEAVPYFLRYFLDGANYDLVAFFCNKQNLEAYNWCMSQQNTIWSTYFKDKADTFGDGKTGICALQGSQVKSYMDSNAYMIDARVKNLNNLLAQIDK